MQQRLVSLIETVSSVGTGFVVSSLAWEFVVKPWWHIQTTISENLEITAFFTVLSIIRGYGFRRAFNYFTLRTIRIKGEQHGGPHPRGSYR